MPQPSSPNLSTARLVLRLAIAANILFGCAILILLVAIPNEVWIMRSLGLEPGAEADRVVTGLHLVAVIGIVICGLNHLILRRLLRIVETVQAGDPFLPSNADRLRQIAWCLLGLQVLGLVIAAIVRAISNPERPIDIQSGASIAGWVAVLFAFVLARVFTAGAAMRDDLRGTI